MAKITYYLGAGASYNACPILNNLAQMMINLAEQELREQDSTGATILKYKFDEEEKKYLPDDNRIKILWYIGYFGHKSKNFNTIDTYARKLFLSDTFRKEYNLLKMSLSVFFDLWENFYEEKFRNLSDKKFKPIDPRYISLLSILLNKNNSSIEINNSFKFITWNYDLQIESAFKSFLANDKCHFETLNNQFRFMENDDGNDHNAVYHLNGHRGFISNTKTANKSNDVELNYDIQKYNEYWNIISWLFNSTNRGHTNFHKFIKYAWEHNLNSEWFKKISNVLYQTEILIIIGYSFPPFNRKIDQFLFSQLNPNKIKKIVYQDPNANIQLIENLFKDSNPYKHKIEVEKDNLNQFYLPNEYFIDKIDENDLEVEWN